MQLGREQRYTLYKDYQLPDNILSSHSNATRLLYSSLFYPRSTTLLFNAMKFIAVTLACVAAVLATDVRYDTAYDNADQSLGTVVCSDGSNGLLTKGFSTFGSLPTFPYIGAAQAIEGYNSANCGSCWKLTYGGETITVTVIDHAGDGFNIAEESLNVLTNGQAEHDGVISATAVEVDMSECGIPA
ncbi:unnamed protein product [Peniophora sp. CBMAI 1063]|nr:unnamed protein product [Peniophora sp. CBMAI 1063]